MSRVRDRNAMASVKDNQRIIGHCYSCCIFNGSENMLRRNSRLNQIFGANGSDEAVRARYQCTAKPLRIRLAHQPFRVDSNRCDPTTSARVRHSKRHSKITGHATRSMFDRYSIVSGDDVTKAMKGMTVSR